MWRLRNRSVTAVYSQSRCIYMRAARKNPQTSAMAKRRREEALERQRELEEERQIKQGIQELQMYNQSLKREIWKNDDTRAKEKAAKAENVDTTKSTSDEEIDALMQGIEDKRLDGKSLFQASAPELPESIASIAGPQALALVSHNLNDWGSVVRAVYNNPKQLQGVGLKDVNAFLQSIPLDQRAGLSHIVHEMMDDAGIVPDKLTYDFIMAGYAHRGNTLVVDAFLEQIRMAGYTPDDFSYGHLIKSLSKNNDLKRSVEVLKRMQQEGLEPSRNVTTTLLQTCIRCQDYKQAFDLFDMMKFQGTGAQPDLRVYNTMLLAAGKQYDVNKVLDLYQEMTTRPYDPLQPNEETYITLIYACARDPRTHLKAWQYLLEMKQRGFVINRKVVNALMYLCGNTGEVSFARALFRQLCNDPQSYPDSFALNCLFKAYSKYTPGFFSPILTTALGNEIRASFLFTEAKTSSMHAGYTPPLLDKPMLESRALVLLESRALLQFFSEHHAHLVTRQVVLSYLRIPAELKSLQEFQQRYDEQTYFPSGPGGQAVDDATAGGTKLERNHYTYDLALEAAMKMSPSPRALEFATRVWTERGEWRKVNMNSMTKPQRDHSDFLFARSMVGVLSLNNETADAIDVLRSTCQQFDWKAAHVQPLLGKLREIEDVDAERLVRKLVNRRHRYQNKVMREYAQLRGDRDYARMQSRQ